MSTPEELATQYLNRNVTIDIGQCLSRGMTLVSSNLAVTIGATWLAILLAVCVHLVPVLGWIAAVVLGPALFGGVQFLMVRRLRGEPVTVGDVFAAFNSSNAILQLMLAGLIAGVFVGIGTMLLVIPGIYLAVAYTFAFPLILDKHLEFWPAMELSRRVVHRHWFSVFFVVLLSAIVAFLGVLAVVIGLLVTVPIAFAAPMCAYEDLFGSSPAVTGA